MNKKSIAALKEYKQLLDDGIITQEEFQKLKEELLFGNKTSEQSKKANKEAETSTTETQNENNSEGENKEEKPQSYPIKCENCGNSDCSKIDDYTYKCNFCGSKIVLKRPDVNINNYNSFANSTDDIPIYKYKKTFDEKEFARKAVLKLAISDDVSPKLLDDLRINPDSVVFAYSTYAEVEYTVDVSYSCMVGTDYKVTYTDGNGRQQSKTETKWESFSGNGNDGGTGCVCCYGKETQTDMLPAAYTINGNDEQIEFTNEDKYPLKRNIDKSEIEIFKSSKIYSLESELKSNLPGHHVRDWHSNGRSTVSKPTAYHYVPTYSLIANSNNSEILFSSLATNSGIVTYSFEGGYSGANAGGETRPTEYQAKKTLNKTTYGKLSIAIIVLSIVSLVASFIILCLAPNVVGKIILGVCAAVSLGVMISNFVVRKKTIETQHHNLIAGFENRKLKSTIKCLSNNELKELTIEEKNKISSKRELPLNDKKKKNIFAALTSFMGALLVAGIVLSFVSFSTSGSHSSGGGSSGGHSSSTTYTLTCRSSNTSYGIVSGGGTYASGTTITVKATACSGYEFKYWYDNYNDKTVSYNSSYSFSMPSKSVSLTAYFKSSNQYMYFGSYPQTIEDDAAIIEALNNSTANPNGYYEYNGVEYAKQTTNPHSTAYTYSNGETAVSSVTRYFKVEPILWRVLSSDISGNYMLLAEQALNAHVYDSSSNNYKDSDIRTWLNDDFYNQAFSTAEKNSILTTTVDNSAATTSSSTNTYACEDTQDKVYLLSYKDYINPSYGFSSSSSTYDSARYCQPTDYALANNCYMSTSSSYDRNCFYWTRSPNSINSYYAWYVYGSGYLYDYHVYYSDGGVRPALSVNL